MENLAKDSRIPTTVPNRPTNGAVDEIIDILTRYLNNDNSWKDMFAWEYFTKGPNGRPVKRGLISGFLGKPNSEKAPYIISLIILIAIYIIGNYLNE